MWLKLIQITTGMHLGARLFIVLAALTRAHSQEQILLKDINNEPWASKYGEQYDQPFSGPLSFSHLPYLRCLNAEYAGRALFDIAVLGMPFDTAVSYRPGARFGPHAIRAGSRRQRSIRGYTLSWGLNPYAEGSDIVDCGDVPIIPFDNLLAIDQMETAYTTLLARPVKRNVTRHSVIHENLVSLAKDSQEHPRIISLGGDHTIVLPILRSLKTIYGPISVIHFDSHLDSWPGYPDTDTPTSRITHGTFFNVAREEGLLADKSSIHAGIRCKFAGPQDIEHDEQVGFEMITTDDIDDYGIPAIVDRIRKRVGATPVYLSFDIDTIDPGLAPGTGTPEAGGWTTREVKRILRGLAGLNFVGADLVEVAPAYDHAEITATAAADIIHDILSMFMAEAPPKTPRSVFKSRDEL